jgi:dihydroorotate dehydrogenase
MAFEGNLAHLEIESPWGNAGGVAKTIEEVNHIAHSGVGWIEAGSYTLEARKGNAFSEETGEYSNNVYYHSSGSGETFNSLGMPNKGMDQVEKEIPEMNKLAKKLGKNVIINVAPTGLEPVTESVELVRRAYEAGASAVLLNTGCPNVVTSDGGRKELLSHNQEKLEDVLEALRPTVQKFLPVFIRTSPMDTYEQSRKIYKTICRSKVVSVLFAPNTWPGHVPKRDSGEEILQVAGGIGGKSGPATAKDSAKQLAWALAGQPAPHRIPVISSSGIVNGYELGRRLRLGAIGGAGTTLYYESANDGYSFAEATDKLLREYTDA